jgi:hypothetical protein
LDLVSRRSELVDLHVMLLSKNILKFCLISYFCECGPSYNSIGPRILKVDTAVVSIYGKISHEIELRSFDCIGLQVLLHSIMVNTFENAVTCTSCVQN